MPQFIVCEDPIRVGELDEYHTYVRDDDGHLIVVVCDGTPPDVQVGDVWNITGDGSWEDATTYVVSEW